MRLPTLILSALSLFAATASAQPVSYQGRFTDNNQTPVGTYELRFTVFDALSGGAPVGSVLTRSVTMATADQGIFSFQDLNFGNNVFTGPSRWLEIAVSKNGEPFTPLSPRQPLNATPYAIYANKSGTTMQDAFQNGRVVSNDISTPLILTGGLQLGSPSQNGLISLFQQGSAQPAVQIFNFGGLGGSLRLRDNLGNSIAFMAPDLQGPNAATFELAGNGGLLSFDGSLSATPGSGSLLTITGPQSSLSFNTSLTGDESLQLPARSVGPSELFAAPGLASIFRNQAVSITSTISTVTSRSITVPAPGYVVVIGTASFGVQRTSNTTGLLLMAVSDVANTMPFATRTALRMPPSTITFGQYDFPGVSHGVFDVGAAGQYTFYLNANSSGFGTPTVSNANLTLLYFPTTYGDVTPNFLAQDPGYAIAPALSREQVLAEQLAEQQRALEELRAEQALMRRQMEEIRRRRDRE